MSKDAMRHHLVTSFICAKCGGLLSLSYETPKSISGSYVSDGVTGAAKVENQIAVHPCDRCYSAVTKPLLALRDALSTLTTAKE